MTKSTNIRSEEYISIKDKESLLNQKGFVLWFSGLSGSGKSTIAKAIEQDLHARKKLCVVLDGDNIRGGISNNLSFSDGDRSENVRRVAEISKLFNDVGVISINCLISPSKVNRQVARDIIGTNSFVEIYLNTPLEVCEGRDVKGLYQKARAGEIKQFTGIDSEYEVPTNPEITLETGSMDVAACVDKVLEYLLTNDLLKD